ncbi:hypothetical protein BC834DRAFT_974684 [Gloeopeniophorella convolvens]|nr:hypothetical protein BC834DRAFT_974684 [Gloeopeniophorella convolvens]
MSHAAPYAEDPRAETRRPLEASTNTSSREFIEGALDRDRQIPQPNVHGGHHTYAAASPAFVPIAPRQHDDPRGFEYQPYRTSAVMYTDDARVKTGHNIRRKCSNCSATETVSWRRSQLTQGRMVCNKCGLYERTHGEHRPAEIPRSRVSIPSREPAWLVARGIPPVAAQPSPSSGFLTPPARTGLDPGAFSGSSNSYGASLPPIRERVIHAPAHVGRGAALSDSSQSSRADPDHYQDEYTFTAPPPFY